MLGSIKPSALAALALALYSSSLTFVSAQNADCTLTVPPFPLTAAGLSTPWQLAGKNQATAGPCNQNNPMQVTFVQGAILNLDNPSILVYNPLVIDAGKVAAIAPAVPTLPSTSIVGLWVGGNQNTITLIDTNGSLQQGNCVNGGGADLSLFGEYCYCNAPAFMQMAVNLINQGLITVPPIAIAATGRPCPTIRDFTLVDQDPSDNVVTSYLLDGQGRTAQDTPANRIALGFTGNAAGASQLIVNASDNRLQSVAMAGALKCPTWAVLDAAAVANMNIQYLPSLPLNELQAIYFQPAPVARVPLNDPMVRINGNTVQDINKVNAYRAGVGQPPLLSAVNNPQYFCQQLLALQPQRLVQDSALTNLPGSSPVPTAANTLFTFLAMRLNAAVLFGGGNNNLNCTGFLGVIAQPFIQTQDGNGVFITATLNPVFTQQLAQSAVAQSNLLGGAGLTGSSMDDFSSMDENFEVPEHALTDAQLWARMGIEYGTNFVPEQHHITYSGNAGAEQSSSNAELNLLLNNKPLLVGVGMAGGIGFACVMGASLYLLVQRKSGSPVAKTPVSYQLASTQ